MVKLNGVYSPTDSIKGFIPQIKAKISQECLDVFYLIMGRTFISNQEWAIVRKECNKYANNCKKCRYHKEE